MEAELKTIPEIKNRIEKLNKLVQESSDLPVKQKKQMAAELEEHKQQLIKAKADELRSRIEMHFSSVTEFSKAFLEMSEISYSLKTMVENVSRHQTGGQNITEAWAAAYRLFFCILETENQTT